MGELPGKQEQIYALWTTIQSHWQLIQFGH